MEDKISIKGNFFKRFITVILIVLAFVGSVNFAFLYIHENFLITDDCTCAIPVSWILAILTSVGIIIGMITFYYLSKTFKDKENTFDEKIKDTLIFLDNTERKILECIIENGGEKHQNKIVQDTDIDKVKVSRKVNNLVQKDIVSKEKNGMTNLIRINEPYRELFVN